MGKFETGQVVVTAGVAAKMEHNPGFIKFILVSFKRYETCDWGNLCPDDAKMNDKAVKMVMIVFWRCMKMKNTAKYG